jgi:hypothetical protein
MTTTSGFRFVSGRPNPQGSTNRQSVLETGIDGRNCEIATAKLSVRAIWPYDEYPSALHIAISTLRLFSIDAPAPHL